MYRALTGPKTHRCLGSFTCFKQSHAYRLIVRRAITLLVLVAACGGTAPAPGPAPEPGPPEATPPSTVASGPTVTPPGQTGSSTTAAHNREPAPDFTLELGEGGSYTLSEGAKPVYLVFWAEW